MPTEDRTLQIKKALEEAILSSPGGDSKILEKVMFALDKKKVLRYHNEDDVSLLSTPGRVLVALAEDPTMTQRALSVYLDLSETMIDKTIKTLISKGLITKTKLNRQNIYKVNTEYVQGHPDIRHFFEAISCILSKNQDRKINSHNNLTDKVGEDELF